MNAKDTSLKDCLRQNNSSQFEDDQIVGPHINLADCTDMAQKMSFDSPSDFQRPKKKNPGRSKPAKRPRGRLATPYNISLVVARLHLCPVCSRVSEQLTRADRVTQNFASAEKRRIVEKRFCFRDFEKQHTFTNRHKMRTSALSKEDVVLTIHISIHIIEVKVSLITGPNLHKALQGQGEAHLRIVPVASVPLYLDRDGST